MRPLRYSINVTLDGCVDHNAGMPVRDTHEFAARGIERVDALLMGRITYKMMEDGWRPIANGERPDWVEEWMVPFAHTIDVAKKYVVSSKLDHVDWNSELVRGNLEDEVRKLKAMPGKGLGTGGVTLPTTLAKMGLIDEYEIVVHPQFAGHGPRLLDGIANHVELKLIDKVEFPSGHFALTYVPKNKP